MSDKRILALFLVIFLLLVSCQQKDISSTEIPEFQVVSAKEIYPEAFEIAQSWSDNAVLFEFVTPIINSKSNDILRRTFLRFLSFDNPIEYLSVRCDIAGCTSELWKWTISVDKFTPVEFHKLEIDTGEAAQIAMLNGGSEYLEKSGWIGHVTLAESKDGTLIWTAYFSHESLGTLSVFIDAISGEVMEILEPE